MHLVNKKRDHTGQEISSSEIHRLPLACMSRFLCLGFGRQYTVKQYLDSGSSGPDLSPGQGLCVLFLGN